MSDSGGVRLTRFFIFNSSFGPKEGQEAEKIIFYHPKSEDVDTRTKHIGLAEAVTRFSSVFGSSSCRSMNTQKTRVVFAQPEPEYWIGMTVSVPFVRKTNKDGSEFVEYSPEDVQDNVLKSLVDQAYDMFSFFMGSFERVMLQCLGDRGAFKHNVDHFFSRYINTLKPGQADILSVFRAVQFLTLDPGPFLSVQCFINRTEAQFPNVKHSVFLHHGNIVWSGLQQRETRLLYHYLNTSLLPSSTGVDASVSRNPFAGHQGRFLAGPKTLQETAVKVPKIHTRDEEELHLVVYHALESTLCLLVPSHMELPLDFFQRLDASIGQQLTHLSADLMDVFGPPAPTPAEPSTLPRYVYYNESNLALKSTVHGWSDLRPSILRVISDLEADLHVLSEQPLTSQTDDAPTELTVKMSNDQWVVARMSEQRKVFVVIPAKNVNLIDVSEEVDKLISAEFRNICFLGK